MVDRLIPSVRWPLSGTPISLKCVNNRFPLNLILPLFSSVNLHTLIMQKQKIIILCNQIIMCMLAPLISIIINSLTMGGKWGKNWQERTTIWRIIQDKMWRTRKLWKAHQPTGSQTKYLDYQPVGERRVETESGEVKWMYKEQERRVRRESDAKSSS